MVEFKDHLKYPFSSFRRLLLGIILTFIPVINIAVFGYVIRAIDHLKQNDRTLPPWSDYPHLFKEGIICILLIIPVAIVAALLNFALDYLFTAIISVSPGITGKIVSIISLAVSLIIFLAFFQIIITIFIRHSYTKDIKHSWKIWTYIPTVLDHYYLKHSLPGLIIFLLYLYIGQAIQMYESILVPIFLFIGLFTYISVAVDNYPKSEPKTRTAPAAYTAPKK